MRQETRRTREMHNQAQRGLRAVLATVLMASTLAVMSCVGPHNRASVRFGPRTGGLSPDTTVVIIRVLNSQPIDVMVLLETPFGLQRIGAVPSMHESIFV